MMIAFAGAKLKGAKNVDLKEACGLGGVWWFFEVC